MKKTLASLVFIALAVAIGLVLIFNQDKSEYRIVKLSGADSYSNGFAYDYVIFTGNNIDTISALPLYDDELIVIFLDDSEFYYYYQIEDGIELNFRSEEYKVFLNDKLVHLEIGNNSEILNFLESAKPEELMDVISIAITDSLTDNYIKQLDILANLNPKLGILDGNKSPGLEYVLSRFDPVWLICYYVKGSNPDSISDLLEKSDNLELLYTDGEFMNNVDISNLSQLKQLIIGEPFIAEQNSVFSFPENLESLSLMDSKIADMGLLTELEELKSLSLSMLSYYDASPKINGLKNLESLRFLGSDNISGFESLGKFSKLKRISFPYNISQHDFEHFLELNNQIEIIETTGSDNLTDISVLSKLPELKCLSMLDSEFPFEAFAPFKGLSYLSISYDPEDDKESIDSLQSKLPNTLIVPSSGLCLGSGWLLILLPLFLSIWMFLNLRKKKLKYIKVYFR